MCLSPLLDRHVACSLAVRTWPRQILPDLAGFLSSPAALTDPGGTQAQRLVDPPLGPGLPIDPGDADTRVQIDKTGMIWHTCE